MWTTGNADILTLIPKSPLCLLYDTQQDLQQCYPFSHLLHREEERMHCILEVFLAS